MLLEAQGCWAGRGHLGLDLTRAGMGRGMLCWACLCLILGFLKEQPGLMADMAAAPHTWLAWCIYVCVCMYDTCLHTCNSVHTDAQWYVQIRMCGVCVHSRYLCVVCDPPVHPGGVGSGSPALWSAREMKWSFLRGQSLRGSGGEPWALVHRSQRAGSHVSGPSCHHHHLYQLHVPLPTAAPDLLSSRRRPPWRASRSRSPAEVLAGLPGHRDTAAG